MSDLGVCRVCLSGNLKLSSILNTPLQVIYEKLTTYKLSTKDGRPETACYNCLSQLQRYQQLLDKTNKSEEILTQLFNSSIKIMPETIAVLNKGIKQNFRITPILFHSSKDENKTVKQEKVVIEESITEKQLLKRTENAVTSEADICRVCLRGDVKTYSIRSTPLQVIFEILTDTKLISEIPKPEVACYICRWLFLKCYNFIKRCKKSENILTELFRNGIQLTQNTVKIINSRIKSNLVISPVVLLTQCSHGYVCQENHKQDDDNVARKVKIDSAEKDAIIQSVSTETTAQFEESQTAEYTTEGSSCIECGFKCDNTFRFQTHLRLHDPNRQYECNICSYRYSSSSHLIAHKRNVHTKKYKCQNCKKKFVTKRQCKMHMLIHTGKPIYKCEECTKIFKDKNAQKHHYRKMHPEYLYSCKYCDATFRSQHYLADHIFKIHAQKFPHYICDVCGRKFSEKCHLRKHLTKVHYNREVFECKTCGKSLYSRQTLKQHQNLHANIKPYECNFCSKTFNSKPNLTMHIMNHTGERPFICNVCDKGFRNKHLLNTHTRVHTKWMYTCNVCNAEFRRKQCLEEHVKTHTTGIAKTYACSICGKIFSLQAELKIHVLRHNKIPVKMPFVTCEICQKEIKNLKEHMKTHTLEKAYTCNDCGNSFSRRGNFILHLRTHNRVKPFTCDICKKSFKKKSTLNCHIKTHNTVKPYKCQECDKSYHLKPQLSTHMKRHFGEKNVFACDQCDKTFAEKRSMDCHKTNNHTDKKKQQYICDLCFKVYTDKKDFIVHIKKHNGKSHFSCEGCKQTFVEISTLAKHMKKHIRDQKWRCTLCNNVFMRGVLCRHYLMVHKGIKPYCCNVCEEGFVQIEQAYNHYLRTHAGDTPYTCRVCNKAYSRNGGLKRHFRIVHFITDNK